jgi:hypothetical protein
MHSPRLASGKVVEKIGQLPLYEVVGLHDAAERAGSQTLRRRQYRKKVAVVARQAQVLSQLVLHRLRERGLGLTDPGGPHAPPRAVQ